ncbi:hypothetical protein L195_g018455 [Trifolium pratense]|uniref:Uncharacterized protein n=1 Tax=Trifolium pratense TaxID=57577 RepID=A0A2K3MWU6_TRIPR|nr:hypothetical protein L195_g018455 [Trifolium pratense]
MSDERSTKPAGMLQLDKETAYHKEIELLNRKLKNKIQEVCDFCQKNHPNGYCILEGISEEEQAKYMGRPNPYSGWRENQNHRVNQGSRYSFLSPGS